MVTITLLEKIYGPYSPKVFEHFFSSLCKDLSVKLRVKDQTDRGWVQITLSGDDVDVAIRFLNFKIGLTPKSPLYSGGSKFCLFKGRIIPSKENDNNLYVDIGVSSPKRTDALISLKTLQAQIADGSSLSFKKIIKLFCLYPNLPIWIKTVNKRLIKENYVEAMLSERQFSILNKWIKSNLERVIVLGAPFSDVVAAIKTSGHIRDIITIEPLGFLNRSFYVN